MTNLEAARQALHQLSDPIRAQVQRGFFINPSEDVFLGVPTPALRKIAREFAHLPLADIRRLMQSTVHEERSLANEILCSQFQKASEAGQTRIFDFYIRYRILIRDWDAVDGSAPYIVGPWLLDRDKAISMNWPDPRVSGIVASQLSRPGGSSGRAMCKTLSPSPKSCCMIPKTSFRKPPAGCCERPARKTCAPWKDSCTSTTHACPGRPSATPSNAFRRRKGRGTYAAARLSP